MSDVEGFDLRTTIKDPKTGKTLRDQPYRMRITQDRREFERPPGSGIFYDEAGGLIRDEKAEAAKVHAAKQQSEQTAAQQKAEALKPKTQAPVQQQPAASPASLAEAERQSEEAIKAAADKKKATESK